MVSEHFSDFHEDGDGLEETSLLNSQMGSHDLGVEQLYVRQQPLLLRAHPNQITVLTRTGGWGPWGHFAPLYYTHSLRGSTPTVHRCLSLHSGEGMHFRDGPGFSGEL